MGDKATSENFSISKKEHDYEVGYSKPPKKTRFKPGQSGNPKGRPKGSRNLKTDLAAELKERVPIREGDKVRKVSKQRALLKATFAKGLGGDVRATNIIFGLVERLLAESDENSVSNPLSKDERNILDRFVKQQIELAENESSNAE